MSPLPGSSPARRGGRSGPRIVSRADWRKLLQLAQACAGDADRGILDDADAQLRLMTLSRHSVCADTSVFNTAGAATLDTAAGLLKVLKAFARPETPHVLRRDLSAVIADGAAFLDRAMDRMATDDFRAAHRNRPEVWS